MEHGGDTSNVTSLAAEAEAEQAALRERARRAREVSVIDGQNVRPILEGKYGGGPKGRTARLVMYALDTIDMIEGDDPSYLELADFLPHDTEEIEAWVDKNYSTIQGLAYEDRRNSRSNRYDVEEESKNCDTNWLKRAQNIFKLFPFSKEAEQAVIAVQLLHIAAAKDRMDDMAKITKDDNDSNTAA